MKNSAVLALPTSDKRVHERVVASAHLELELQSIAGGTRYPFETINLSKGGFLIQGDPSRSYPFTSSSILNVWIYPNKTRQEPIQLLACPLRKNEKNEIALKIVQIDPDNKIKLYAFIDELFHLLGPHPEAPF